MRVNSRRERKKERKVRKDYIIILISLRKKSIISSTLYHSVILAFIRAFEFLASRRLFLYRDCPLSPILLYCHLFVFPFVLSLLSRLLRKITIILRSVRENRLFRSFPFNSYFPRLVELASYMKLIY